MLFWFWDSIVFIVLLLVFVFRVSGNLGKGKLSMGEVVSVVLRVLKVF